MLSSTITSKGQTTIPKEIREFLGLSPKSTIFYTEDPERKRVVLTAVTGNILGLRGVVPHKGGPIDFKKMREETVDYVVKRYQERSR
jgi:AbrB family looped-hinge helix DNA binding protein